jgi:hypothetical protein
MKIKEISYLVPPTDLVDDCLDVLVSLEDEHCTDGFCGSNNTSVSVSPYGRI